MSHHKDFKEGHNYTFHIIKEVQIDKDELYFVLEDPTGNRHLLNETDYKHYTNLISGTDIECRIDKVNCTGKIFMEPENPIYKPGLTYSFIIESKVPKDNAFGYPILELSVKDEFGHSNKLDIIPREKNLEINELIELKVENIRKGDIHLSDPLLEKRVSKLEIGKIYYFHLVNEIEFEGEQYYILHDQYKNAHLLPIKHYKKYSLQLNSRIKAKVISYNPKAYYDLEPEHPVYKEGKIYNFEFVKKYRKNKSYINNAEVNVVLDHFGNELFAATKKSNYSHTPGDLLKYKVERMRKGKPILRNI